MPDLPLLLFATAAAGGGGCDLLASAAGGTAGGAESAPSSPLVSAVQFVVIFLLVFANGFFVAAEFALVKVRSSQLLPLMRKGGLRVRFAIKATKHLDAVLSATQLGITLASLALGWIGEPFIARQIAPLLAAAGVTAPAAATTVSFALAFAFITFFHIVLGELAPKSLAIQRPRQLALWTGAPLYIFYYAFYPAIWALNSAANLILRALGFGKADESQSKLSDEELEYVFSHARHADASDALVDRIMVQALRSQKTTARQIMIPADDVTVLWLDRPIRENITAACKEGYSRYPVCSGTRDNLKGLLLTREWLWQMQVLEMNECPIEPLLHDLPRVAPETTVPELLQRFNRESCHMFAVIEPNGRFAGILTFEDVLEELLGEIRDEFDSGDLMVLARAPDEVLVDARISLRDLLSETGWTFEGFDKADLSVSLYEWLQQRPSRTPLLSKRPFTLGDLRIKLQPRRDAKGRLRRCYLIRRMPEPEHA
ncbi:MAG: hemolysin family protein [Puniceicoccales bacterium]|jgi:CBS domain containing-hemolysin-like protein|nr:hemolysin family protein [Puniceicoccales bacterium]